MFFGGGFPGAEFGGFPGGGFPGGGGRARKEVDTNAFYEALGVSKSASKEEIRKAYRKLAIKHHPDKGGDEETFKKLTKAYETLSDDQKRKTYDQFGEEGLEQGGGGGNPHDIFADLFGGGGMGGGRRGPRKGEDVTHPLDVTLEQFYKGATRKLAVNRSVMDGVCQTCADCKGRGQKVRVIRAGNVIQQMQSVCDSCNGKGKMFKLKNEKEIVEVYVERGGFDGHSVRFSGKGDEGPDQEPGDVVFNLKEKAHPVFKRKKADLFVDRKITLLEALTGYTTEIVHLDGRKLLIETAPGDVIMPPLKKDFEWLVFEDTDSPGEDVAKANTLDKSKLIEACEEKGVGGGFGFVINHREGTAYFREKTREQWMSQKKSNKSTKGVTLYVCPDPKEMAKFRMQKAVAGEGMPVFKNPTLRGNLFINITIDFPKSISEDAAKQLKAILPSSNEAKEMEKLKKNSEDHEMHTLVDMDPNTSEKAVGNVYEDQSDDEDGPRGRGGPGGGQNVQCAQQ